MRNADCGTQFLRSKRVLYIYRLYGHGGPGTSGTAADYVKITIEDNSMSSIHGTCPQVEAPIKVPYNSLLATCLFHETLVERYSFECGIYRNSSHTPRAVS